MVNLKVGDFVRLSASQDNGVVFRHLERGVEYKVTEIRLAVEGYEYVFLLDGGKCNRQDCVCTYRGWAFTSEFEKVQEATQEELKSAAPLPPVEDVARHFGISLR